MTQKRDETAEREPDYWMARGAHGRIVPEGEAGPSQLHPAVFMLEQGAAEHGKPVPVYLGTPPVDVCAELRAFKAEVRKLLAGIRDGAQDGIDSEVLDDRWCVGARDTANFVARELGIDLESEEA